VAFKIAFLKKKGINILRQMPNSHCTTGKPQWRPKNHRLSPFLTNFGKKLSLFHHWEFQSSVYILFASIVFTLTLPTIFYQNKFTVRSSRSEGERLKAKFWPLEIKKSGRGCKWISFGGYIPAKPMIQ
jgi:hypothetical protein